MNKSAASRQHTADSNQQPATSNSRRNALALLLLLLLTTPCAEATTPGEARFFSHCPRRAPVHLHDERRPWDLHAILYTTLGVSEVEVVRMVDWVIDLSLPGVSVAPCHRTIEAIRAGYHRLPSWTLTRRVGELVDAFQLAELSLGDASATYSVATGGVAGPGSGTVIRIHKLIDWSQHVTADVNRLSGRIVGRPRGLVTWSLPRRAMDGLQWVLIKTFTDLRVVFSRTLDGAMTAAELVGEEAINMAHRRPHEGNTAFLRLPSDVCRAHELWILEHRAHLVLGAPATFAQATHAELFHQRRLRLTDWSVVDQLLNEEREVIVMTTVRVISRAPESLKAYVVPAAWALDDSPTFRSRRHDLMTSCQRRLDPPSCDTRGSAEGGPRKVGG